MADKKQKTETITKALTSADKCAQAIDTVLETMEPPLKVPSVIPRLIVEFAEPYGEISGMNIGRITVMRAVVLVAVRFGVGGDLASFDISDGGRTATRNARHYRHRCCVCATPNLLSGKPSLKLEARCGMQRRILGVVGVHEATFRVDRCVGSASLGVVPATWASSKGGAAWAGGSMYASNGNCCEGGKCDLIAQHHPKPATETSQNKTKMKSG